VVCPGGCRRTGFPSDRSAGDNGFNKRLAWSATRAFCLLNGHDLTYTVDESEDLMLSAASGQLDVPDIADWLAAAWDPRHVAASDLGRTAGSASATTIWSLARWLADRRQRATGRDFLGLALA
jgi:hypothetical protein